MTWGAQANGLAPQRRHQLRVMAARALKLQKSGSVDIVFDMNKHPDPGDVIILQHVHTIWKLYHSFDDSKRHLFNSSWNLALAPLRKAKYPWQVVTGPLQALQAYLLDLGFDRMDINGKGPGVGLSGLQSLHGNALARVNDVVATGVQMATSHSVDQVQRLRTPGTTIGLDHEPQNTAHYE